MGTTPKNKAIDAEYLLNQLKNLDKDILETKYVQEKDVKDTYTATDENPISGKGVAVAVNTLQQDINKKSNIGHKHTKSEITDFPTSMTPTAHNQASNTINAMTDYSKATSVSAITPTDTLNVAIGKLEKALDSKGTSSFSGSYNDLTDKPIIPSVGNGTITVNQNGTKVGEFSTNQSTNTAINLTNTTYDVATSSKPGLVKSGTDITVDSSGNVSVNDDSHNHIISNVDGLQSALDGKAASSHTHDDRYYTESEINTKLNSKLNTSLKGSANGLAELDSNGKVLSSQLPSFVDDIIEGYLSGGKFYKESTHTTEITGETGKIYIDLTTNKTYRWSGSAFVVVSETLALGETSSTAYRGDKGKIAYDHSQSTHARTDATKVEKSSTNGNIKINGTETTVYTHPGGTNPHGTTKSDVGLGNVPNVTTNDQTPSYTEATTLSKLTSGEKLSVAFGKISKAITNFISHIGNKNNPHGVTKSQIGLGNVEDKSSATIRSELTKENVTTALGYTPPTTNTTYGAATSSVLGLVKSGTDITVDSSGNVSVNDNSHNHVISNVDGLQSALDGKAASSHTHNYAGSSSAGGAANSALGLSPFTISNIDELDSFLSENVIMKYAKASNCNIGFASNDGLVISLPWSSRFGAQIAIDDQSNWMGIRAKNNGTWNSWSKIALESEIESKLSGKANSSHTHTKSQITDFPTSLPASDVYSWAKASSKPSYSWNEITSKPSTFTPASHTHNYAGSSSAGGDANRAMAVADYGDASKTINIGFSGPGISGDQIGYIAGYTDNGTKIKDVSKDALKGWIGLGSAAYTNSSSFAAANHSHNYAGSSSAGGSANSAVKLDTATAGSATQPVYFSGGKPVECSYTLGKSVPSDAVFTDTDTKVTNTLDSHTKAYVTGTTSASTNTGTQIFDTGVYLGTGTGQLTLEGSSNINYGTGASIFNVKIPQSSNHTLYGANIVPYNDNQTDYVTGLNINCGKSTGPGMKGINVTCSVNNYQSTVEINRSGTNSYALEVPKGKSYIATIYSNSSTITTSDREKKTDIQSISDKYEELFFKLQPRLFKFKDGTSGRIHIGAIAQEVEEALKDVGLSDTEFAGFVRQEKDYVVNEETGEITQEEGYDYYLRYEEFVMLLCHMLQKLYAEKEEQDNKISDLESRIVALESKLG